MRVRDILDQMHHEELIVEISDLIHRQLVTSSLNGNFRNVLERRLRVRRILLLLLFVLLGLFRFAKTQCILLDCELLM